jgi:hypothetical protein
MQCARFAVDEKPRWVWGHDIRKENLYFLDSVDPTFFEFNASSQVEALEGEQGLKAAISLRLNYGLGLEALFAYLGAAIQSPDCVFGWLNLYKPGDLPKIVRQIKDGKPILNKLDRKYIGWTEISEIVHTYFRLEDEAKRQRIVHRFGELWSYFADDFLDPNARAEFNRIKHGIRIHPGGFELKAGRSATWGVPCPPEKMQSLGKCKFGSSCNIIEPILGSNTNYRVIFHSRNWAPINFANGLILISMSLSNIIGWLKIANGIKPTKVQFYWPEDDGQFESPWRESVPVISTSHKENFVEGQLKPLTDQEILSIYGDRPKPQANNKS